MTTRLFRSGTLHAPHLSPALVVRDPIHLALLGEAQLEQSIDPLVDLLIGGQIIAISPFEPIRVVEDALTTVRVETLDGTGRGGWVPSGWLRLDSAPARRGVA